MPRLEQEQEDGEKKARAVHPSAAGPRRRRERGVDGHLELLSLSFSLFPERHLLGTAEQAEALPLRGQGEEANFSHKVTGGPVRPPGKVRLSPQLMARLCPGWLDSIALFNTYSPE